MKLSEPPKLLEKLVWVPIILFCKISIPNYPVDALLDKRKLTARPLIE
jgi:hypothetical protein